MVIFILNDLILYEGDCGASKIFNVAGSGNRVHDSSPIDDICLPSKPISSFQKQIYCLNHGFFTFGLKQARLPD